MKKTTLLAVMALLCLNFLVKAQTSTQFLQPLKVGEQLPDSVWNMRMQLLNGNQKEITLKQFKGKLIILDFWATWCTSCIKKFDSLDSWQKQFNPELQILLVNSSIVGDTDSKMMDLLAGHTIPTLTGDKLLKKLFPHTYIPHYVWIAPNGRVLAFTAAAFVNEITLKNALNTTLNPH